MSSVLSNLNLGGDDLKLELIPNKTEAKVTISRVSFTERSENTGKPYLSVILNPDLDKFPSADPIFQVLMLPCEENDKMTNKNNRRRLATFCDCFGLDYDFDPTNEEELNRMWEGAEGWVVVGVNSDPNYGDKNVVSKFMPPAKG